MLLPVSDMEAFDLLPPKIRAALMFASAKHSALEVMDLLLKERNVDNVFYKIIKTDAHMVANLPPMSTEQGVY